jgi:arylsulfatase A-like enzyme
MRRAYLLLTVFVFVSGCWSRDLASPDRISRKDLLAAASEYNILVILLDTAAAGHFGFMGYDRPTSPNLDRIAAESVVFEQAYSQATGTPVSVYSLFTSRYPVFEQGAGVRSLQEPERPYGDDAFFVPKRATTLAEAMARRFPHRLAVSCNAFVSRKLGYGQGFTSFYEEWKKTGGRENKRPWGGRIARRALPWMTEHRNEGFFAYLHYIEPHAPYLPPEPHLSRLARRPPRLELANPAFWQEKGWRPTPELKEGLIDLYDGLLSYVDAEVGKIADALRADGSWERTIFALVSDHGEGFWQHGLTGHGGLPHEELVWVPFLLRIPGIPQLAGKRIAAPVELADLMPTLLELAGVRTDDLDFAGRSLVRLLLAEAPPREEDMSRLVHMRSHSANVKAYAMRRGRFKWFYFIDGGRVELYDLEEDPGEAHDLLAEGEIPPEAVEFPERLREWLAQDDEEGGRWVKQRHLDLEAREALQALGYIE